MTSSRDCSSTRIWMANTSAANALGKPATCTRACADYQLLPQDLDELKHLDGGLAGPPARQLSVHCGHAQDPSNAATVVLERDGPTRWFTYGPNAEHEITNKRWAVLRNRLLLTGSRACDARRSTGWIQSAGLFS
jgi:hypothetical protein